MRSCHSIIQRSDNCVKLKFTGFITIRSCYSFMANNFNSNRNSVKIAFKKLFDFTRICWNKYHFVSIIFEICLICKTTKIWHFFLAKNPDFVGNFNVPSNTEPGYLSWKNATNNLKLVAIVYLLEIKRGNVRISLQ